MTPHEVPDAAFVEVELPSYVDWKASPEIPFDERGILIAAPRQVAVSPKMRLPVCASAIVQDSDVPYRTNLWDVVVGVAVDVRSNHAYAQALFDPRLVPDPDDEAEPDVGPPKAAAPLASEPGDAKTGGPEEPPIVEMETSIRVYGNFDLMDFLDIPRAPATLYIHFTLGGHQSNVVRVELVTVREED